MQQRPKSDLLTDQEVIRLIRLKGTVFVSGVDPGASNYATKAILARYGVEPKLRFDNPISDALCAKISTPFPKRLIDTRMHFSLK